MSDLNTIDYTPLDAMQGIYSRVFKQSLRTGTGLLAVAGIIVLIGAAIVTHAINLPFYGIFGYVAYVGYLVNKSRNNIWQAFAKVNGWPLAATPTMTLIPPGMQFGHSQKYSPIIQAKLAQIACDLFTYECTTGSGKSSQTHLFTVARVALPQTLPHMQLLSTSAGADVKRDMADGQDLQLEGDFSQHFKLQIEKGQQIDALTILTPDVMQTLIDYNNNEDIEILGTNLYIILSGDDRGSQEVARLIQSVVALNQQILENIHSFTSAKTTVGVPITVPAPVPAFGVSPEITSVYTPHSST